MSHRKASLRSASLAFIGLLVMAGVVAGYLAVSTSQYQRPTTTPRSTSSTGTSANSSSNIFFTTSCVITGVGDFALRVVSDSTGTPVRGESIHAVDRLGCGSMPQIVYLNDFTTEQGGWLTPIWPGQATPAGALNFTIIYQGRTYNF